MTNHTPNDIITIQVTLSLINVGSDDPGVAISYPRSFLKTIDKSVIESYHKNTGDAQPYTSAAAVRREQLILLSLFFSNKPCGGGIDIA